MRSELEMIIHAFVSSRLNHCNSLITCLSKSSINRLQPIQNAAARLLTRSIRSCHITPILASVHWVPVHFRIHFKILVFTYLSIHGQAPSYISELLHPYDSSRWLRSSDEGLLAVPQTRLKAKGDRAFDAVAPRLWNAFPLELRAVSSVIIFKKQLKAHLFDRHFINLCVLHFHVFWFTAFAWLFYCFYLFIFYSIVLMFVLFFSVQHHVTLSEIGAI